MSILFNNLRAENKIFFYLFVIFIFLLVLFFTPPWWGTDIVVWAATPIFVLQLYKASLEGVTIQTIIQCYLIFLISYLFRYSSLYLLFVFGFFVLFVCNERISKKIKDIALFSLPVLLLFLAGQYLIKSNSLPFQPLKISFTSFLENFLPTVQLLKYALTPYLFFVPESIRESIGLINQPPSLIYSALSILIYAGLFISIFYLRKGGNKNNLPLILFFVTLANTLFLFVYSVFQDWGYTIDDSGKPFIYIAVLRYYLPSGFSGIFLVVFLLYFAKKLSFFSSLRFNLSLLFIVPFLLYFIFRISFPILGNQQLKEKWFFDVFGYRSAQFMPGFNITTVEKERQFIQELSINNPQALIYVVEYPWFCFDNINHNIRNGSRPFNKIKIDREVEVFVLVRSSSNNMIIQLNEKFSQVNSLSVNGSFLVFHKRFSPSDGRF
ncbi:MAG: hypothetical protein SFU91_06045 [Chloroherpetonaceae bacterium]|nr:hypothetical protein [Chloroherpetonaceae bacterium]